MILAPLRRDAKNIFQAGIAAVDPARAVCNALSLSGRQLRCLDVHMPLPDGQIKVIAAGKAAVPMVVAVEQLLGSRLAGGLAITKDGHGGALRSVELLEASHPVPDSRGQAAAMRVLELADAASEKDLLIALISGGGSALLPAPAGEIRLEDKMAVTDLLLGCGAGIDEINTVRKHLSLIKGGQLARRTLPARLLTLVISDVIGDHLDVISSGPSVADPSSFKDALTVLEKYSLHDACPETVVAYLQQGLAGEAPETPKPGEISERCQTRIIASNAMAVTAARKAAEQLGYRCLSLGSATSGEASITAKDLVACARENAGRHPLCLLAGGETTVTVRGTGKGGRNQELALSGAIALEGSDDMVLLAGGTDGNDGPTDAAGAIVDGQSLSRGRAKGLSAEVYLQNNDSYTWHQATGDLLLTGPTRTNVMDLNIILFNPGADPLAHQRKR